MSFLLFDLIFVYFIYHALFFYRELTILVEANAEDTEIELLISYVVYDASWMPKYDIRVFSNDKEKSMTVNIYILIIIDINITLII